MAILEIVAQTREEALREALSRLRLPEEALDIEYGEEAEDLLAGARPQVLARVSVRDDYVLDRIRESLEALLEKMEIDATVHSGTVEGILMVSASCGKPDVLIGHHGETLDAIQHLVVRMTGLSGREAPLILIDVGDYRKRRIERLLRVVHDLSELVLESGEEEFLDPMSAVDRKIVHTLLKNIDGIKSYSRGEGEARHVIVAPAD